MSTFNQNEVLVSTDNAGQLWNICVWDAHSGSSLTAFKVELLDQQAIDCKFTLLG